MSAELVGILSVGATLIVGGLAAAGAVVGLILRLESRLSARMGAMDERLTGRIDRLSARLTDVDDRLGARMDALDERLNARMDRLGARMDRMDARMDTFEARQYETIQVVVRMEANQQAMLETLGRIEERTRSAGNPPEQPTLFGAGSTASDDPRQSAPESAPSPA